MYAHLLPFEKKTTQKGPIFPILKRSPSIHKNNPALVASIVLKKIYFHGICALSKKNTFNFTRSCAFAQKAKFYALKMLKNKISRILKLPSWQYWSSRILLLLILSSLYFILFLFNLIYKYQYINYKFTRQIIYIYAYL